MIKKIIRRLINALRSYRYKSEQKIELELLLDMLDEVPERRDELNDWAKKVSGIIGSQILSRATPMELSLMVAGIVSYRRSGYTPDVSHQACVDMYCRTSGYFQRILHKILYEDISSASISMHHDDKKTTSLLPPVNVDDAVSKIQLEGYFKWPHTLREDVLSSLKEEMTEFSYKVRRGGGIKSETLKYREFISEKFITADALEADVSCYPTFRSLANDWIFLSIAQKYLKSQSVRLLSTGLRITGESEFDDAEAAQLFHYDLDTLRFIKVFIYLDEVTECQGPHCYVQGSHAPGSKPASLLRKRYERISDKSINKIYPYDMVKVTGCPGTIFIGDTVAYHKGSRVKSGTRVAIINIYSASRFCFDHGRA